MPQSKFVLGIDFGTESGRALLVDATTGQEIASAVHTYAGGVIDERLPGTNIRLEPDWALQNPADYIEVLKRAVPSILKSSGISPDDVIGIGLDFTACTILPIQRDGTPLCFLPEWRNKPHAWVKLWKHHAAQPEADRINALANARSEPWLATYGGKISSEWLLPKALQILDEAPEVFEATDKIIEAGDWVVWQLTGHERRNSCAAGYKGLWDKRAGYPSNKFLRALDPRLDQFVDRKLARDIYPVGTRAGELTRQAAEWTDLRAGTAVAVATIDAHASVPGAGVTEPGRLVLILGTSTCHMIVDRERHLVPGISGVVEDGIIPGLFGYEGGQAGVGDIFEWFVERAVPGEFRDRARAENTSVYAVLEEEAGRQKPGEAGLLALDWWNGNRSVLVDANLSGLLVGATLGTRAPDIYRALIEATAFGTEIIVETFEANSVKVDELVACGGLAERNKLLMQIYADVTGRTLKQAGSSQASALGAAMFGAVAAGRTGGGYASITDAARHMAVFKEVSYAPNSRHHAVYQKIFAEYLRLYDYFGRGENNVMKNLRRIRDEAHTG